MGLRYRCYMHDNSDSALALAISLDRIGSYVHHKAYLRTLFLGAQTANDPKIYQL